MSEASKNANINSKQEMNWISDTSRVARLVAEGNTDLAPVFWVRLYGILHDIYDKRAGHRSLAILNGIKPHPLLVDFLKAIEELAGLFSPDELLYIQYRRDAESHPVQRNYEFRVDGKGQAIELFKHKLLSQQVPVTLEVLHAAVRRLLATVNHEIELAPVMAKRCTSSLAVLSGKASLIY